MPHPVFVTPNHHVIVPLKLCVHEGKKIRIKKCVSGSTWGGCLAGSLLPFGSVSGTRHVPFFSGKSASEEGETLEK